MLLNRPVGEEFIKVLDFGIAKLRSTGSGDTQPLTQLGTVFGTPEYMSPEQARGLEVDGRSDLYTLGLILYEMLSGESPFSHDDVVVILARQLSMQPPALADRVSVGTRDLVRKLLEKEREARPATAAQVREALDALLARAGDKDAPLVEVELAASEPAPGRESQSSDAPTQLALPKASADATELAPAPARSRVFEDRAPPSTVRKPRPRTHFALFGYAVPKRALHVLAGLVGLAFALTVVLLLVSGEPAPPARDPVADAQARASALAELVVKAERGDAAALATLFEVPVAERTPSVWRTLISGKCPNDPCFELVKAGLAAVPALIDEPVVVRELRRLAGSETHGPAALELAATQGERGADIVHDVTSDRSLAKSPLSSRAKALLEDERVRSKMSPALAALLRLSGALKAPRCGELKRLLAEVGGAFDGRALPALGRLGERRGCGLLGLGDCYSCLRSGRELKTALEAAKSRASPRFDALPKPAGSVP
jgi:serine/threonine-protein kinase